ncbi:MAG TPA: outer membrane lipoprotein chaperone LolA [Thermodesulfobacteriota bacterium]|nr:outer membrane lipoprotein chaperone LolA [Thermodesulfobacteriota bacterium]
MNSILKLLIALLIAVPNVAISCWAQEPVKLESLLAAIKGKYSAIDSLEAHFVQKNFVATLNQVRELEGTLYLKRPHLFRMDVTSPSPQQLVFDGKYYWVYTEASCQVLKNPVPPDFSQHPLINLIHTMENLEQDFIISQGVTQSADEHSLTLALKESAGDIEGVNLIVSKNLQIRRLMLRYSNGNNTQFFLSAITENPHIASEQFRFEPPAGAEVIENPVTTQTP